VESAASRKSTDIATATCLCIETILAGAVRGYFTGIVQGLFLLCAPPAACQTIPEDRVDLLIHQPGCESLDRSAVDIETLKARVADLRQSGDARAIPVDLVTASGSGLDPDISVASAQFQATRVAEARGVPLPQIDKLIASNTTPRAFGILGEARVNVLKINQALDLLSSAQETPPTVP